MVWAELSLVEWGLVWAKLSNSRVGLDLTLLDLAWLGLA